MTDPIDRSDEGLGRRLRSELPRYEAPARLRAAVLAAAPRPRIPWLAPGLAALATAAVLLLFVVPGLPSRRQPDTSQMLLRSVVSEYSRALMWGARRSEVVPVASAWLTQESGITLVRAFAGDDVLTLVAAEPVYLMGERGVALHYRDREGHLVSYIALPAPALKLADRDRVQVDRFRPVLARDAGFAAWMWKHGDVACFLVSDVAAGSATDRFKDYFVRVRTGTEPLLAY